MGRKPKPTKLKKIQGTYRKDRAFSNEMEPETVKDIPSAPTHFEGKAKEIWETTVKHLKDIGLLTQIDLPLLRAYCWYCWLAEQAQKALKKEGAVYTRKNAKGEELQAKNPWVNVHNNAIDHITKIAARFGLDPASRTKISVPKKEGGDLSHYFE